MIVELSDSVRDDNLLGPDCKAAVSGLRRNTPASRSTTINILDPRLEKSGGRAFSVAGLDVLYETARFSSTVAQLRCSLRPVSHLRFYRTILSRDLIAVCNCACCNINKSHKQAWFPHTFLHNSPPQTEYMQNVKLLPRFLFLSC